MFYIRLFLLPFACFFILLQLEAQVTSIPDPNFEQALIDLDIDSDGEINGSVPTSDLLTVISLDVSEKEISNLTGIEGFLNLKDLYCHNNLLESLNIADNTELEILDCSLNQLSNISVKSNAKLKILRCGQNKIRVINVSDNPDLEELDLNDNLLLNLNVKSNRELTFLNCASNQISILLITDNWNLNHLDFSSNNLSLINLVNNVRLTYLNSSNNPIIALNTQNLTALKTIEAIDNDLVTMVDFDQNYNLESISCYNNDALSNIEVNGAVALRYLNCRNSNLTILDLSQNVLLESLYCQNNKITGLDLSLNTKLTFLKCNDNDLENLNIRNGQNILMTGGFTDYEGNSIYMEGMNAMNNEKLLCINVDNEADAQNKVSPYDSWLKDDNTFYSEDCESVLAVEDHFIEESINMYPNPANESICVRSDKQDIDHIVIYSVLGNQIKNIQSDFSNIIIQDLKPGMYFLRIKLEHDYVFKKMIKN